MTQAQRQWADGAISGCLACKAIDRARCISRPHCVLRLLFSPDSIVPEQYALSLEMSLLYFVCYFYLRMKRSFICAIDTLIVPHNSKIVNLTGLNR